MAASARQGHPRRGFRPAYYDARGEGWTVNHKKIQWLWREEGLRVPQRRRRKRLGASTVNPPKADAPNKVWAVDFQFDATTDAPTGQARVHRRRAHPRMPRHGVTVGNRLPAIGANLARDILRWLGSGVRAVEPASEVVDHDGRAPSGQ
jgi:transposase InsO family protein